MRVRELFRPTQVSSSINGSMAYLDRENCQIESMEKKESKIIFNLKRNSDDAKGVSHLKVRDEYKDFSSQLFSWVLVNKDIIIGLTLNQFDNLETGLNIKTS